MSDELPGVDALLPCGRSIDRAWEALSAPAPDEHTLTCPWCAELAGEVARLRAALDGPPGGPDPGREAVDDALLRRVLRQVLSELRPGRSIPTRTDGVTVSEQALVAAVRAAADAVPGALTRRVRVQPRPGEPGVVDLQVRVVVDLTTPVPQIAALVRAATQDVVVPLDLTVGRVDVDVVDVQV